MSEQLPEQNIVVHVQQGHTARNLGIAAVGVGALVYLGNSLYEATNGHADSHPQASAGVNHESEVWSDFSMTCDKKVTEFVGVTGIQHNVIAGGLTSGGLKVDKALEGDFLICGSQGQINGRREKIMKNGKLDHVILHFSNTSFAIESPRVDHLNPANQAPLRADDSMSTVDKKLAKCDAKHGKDSCDDTGVKIMWPKLYQDHLPLFGDVSIPGPHIAINPDESLKLASLMNTGAQLAIALDGTTIERWQAELTSFQEAIRQQEADATGVPVTVEAEALPTEEQVISQRLNQLSPDLKEAFKVATFEKGKHDTAKLHLVDWHDAKLDILLSDVSGTDATLQTLNDYLKQSEISK